LITPPIATDVFQFLEQHIKHDLFLLRKIFDKNGEDTKLLIHLLLKSLMMNTNKNGKYSLYLTIILYHDQQSWK